MQGITPQFVIVDEWNDTPMSVVESEEDRLNRTNNVWVIDNPKGIKLPTPKQGEAETDVPEASVPTPEPDYDQTEATPYEPRFSELKVRTWLAHVQPERLLAWGVLAAAAIGLARRKQPKRTRVDYHVYVHQDKTAKQEKK